MAQIAYCRDFNGSNTYITIDGGSLASSALDLHTAAIIAKFDTLGGYQGLIYMEGPLGDAIAGVSVDTNDDLVTDAADGVSNGVSVGYETSTHVNQGQWLLVVVRKITAGNASNALVCSVYNYTLGTWLHYTAANAVRASPINLNNFKLGLWESSDYLDGKIACAAYANGNLFASNAAIESSGVKDNLQAWVDAGFSEGWLLDQTDELLGITTFAGTSVLTADLNTLALSISDLPFDVALSGGPTPQKIRPDADITTTGWNTAPLWSKIEEESADGTVITGVAS